jgi:uncharacterized heparinase superfamily protein
MWGNTAPSRLWRYNLHYLDDLDARRQSEDAIDRATLLDDWIANNPPAAGTGWEPYPLSLRIVNIVKFASAAPTQPERWRHSLGLQAQSLAQQLESHLRANHLFENAKALVFAGAYLDGQAANGWLHTGLRILDAECAEQFLPDGGHFELSPMYHGIMLWNLCDLVNLAEISGLPELLARASGWRSFLQRGLSWYAAMTHPDGRIAFFNDAAFGIAPGLAETMAYAAAVGVPVSSARRGPLRVEQLRSSGYLRVDLAEESAAIIDVARVGPDYQPGHAHADTLSFELSVAGQRVLVNSGTSTYEPGQLRSEQRGTAAHNTVVVDGRNSSDTWAAFRVGRRANAQLLEIEERDDLVRIRAAHDGYSRGLRGARHVRRWTWGASSVHIRDDIEGPFAHAVAYYHLHPGVVARTDPHDPRCVQLDLAAVQVSLRVLCGRAHLSSGLWYPEFGRPGQQCGLVAVDFDGVAAEVVLEWRAGS